MTQVSLYLLPSRTNLRLHNISVNSKIVKKVIANLDTSKVSGPDYIPVVVLKNCKHKLSYKLVELFNMYLRGSCFPDCLKVSSLVPVFKNVVENSTVSKVFEKLKNNRIVDYLEKCGVFCDFQYGFRSSYSTADFLMVVSDRIVRVFNRSGAT